MLNDRLFLPSAPLEWQFQREVVRFAEEHGWLVHYSIAAHRRGMLRTQQGGANGFPDLVLARDGVVLLAELKVGRRRLTGGQREWAAAGGASAVVWRPADAAEIEEVLR